MNWNSACHRANARLSIRNLTTGAAAATVMAVGLFAAVPADAETASVFPEARMTPISEIVTGSIEAETNKAVRSDRLAVTVANFAGPKGLAAHSKRDMDIWVGEVELKGRKAIWVELIDSHGEVIYDAEVATNETHLLPDGRAIVVRTLEDAPTVVAKADVNRIETDAQLVITRRVVDSADNNASIEFLQETEKHDPSAMVAVAGFGERVWAAVTGFFSAAASNVRFAFSWIVSAFTA